jgi:hypothetical protein
MSQQQPGQQLNVSEEDNSDEAHLFMASQSQALNSHELNEYLAH